MLDLLSVDPASRRLQAVAVVDADTITSQGEQAAACAGDRTFIGLRLPGTGRTILLRMRFSSRAASSAFFRTDQVIVAVFGL